MRDQAVATWQEVNAHPSVRCEFVVTLNDGPLSARFSSNTDFEATDEYDLRPGLITDLNGIFVEIDPRTVNNPMPSIPSIELDEAAVIDALGALPQHPGAMTVEVALVNEKLLWKDRIILVAGVPVSHLVEHTTAETLIINLLDPLDKGHVTLPGKLIDPTQMPSAWNQAYVQQNLKGKPFPICFGEMYRTDPLKIYDDGGAGNGAAAQPIRRYILAAGQITGSSATVHRRNYEIQDAQAAYDDYSETVITTKTEDGFTFSYIETDGADGGGPPNGDEDPTVAPPKECQAISFTATSGDAATMGGVIRDLIERWTDITIDEIMERSLSDVVAALRSLVISVIVNGEGGNQASANQLIEGRFVAQMPMATSRTGGQLEIVPLYNLMRAPGFGYLEPAAVLNVDHECYLMGAIRETGEILNSFVARYKRRETGDYDGLLLLTPDNDTECASSASYYGVREAGEIVLDDIADSSVAGMVLEYQRDTYSWPWYETDVFCPFDYTYIRAGMKIRLAYETASRLTDCRRFRHNLKHGTGYRDAIVTRIAYYRTGLVLTVIF